MSARDINADETEIESRDQLAAYLEAGAKPPADWRIGTEHEKIGYYHEELTPIPYEGERGIEAFLKGMSERFAWVPVYEDGRIIALSDPHCPQGGSITLEPGGQLELSGAPLETLHQACAEVSEHLAQVRAIATELGIGFMAIGFSPKWHIDETPQMPKGRYAIMRRYMPRVGRSGLDMMYRSATVQVNLDFSDEADMVKKLRVGLALQPIVTAIFANSPFADGRPNGFMSYRSEVWRHTDPARTGMMPFAFEDGMGFERYVDYALDVPMYFVKRANRYIDVSGASFRDFLAGRLEALPGMRPRLVDWSNHLTTLFPEVRLKRFLEMRGADSGPRALLCGLSALWTGLLYDAASLEACWALIRDWSTEERQSLRDQVPRTALATPFRSASVREIAADIVRISRDGLEARARLGRRSGRNEAFLLDPIEAIVAEGRCPARDLLERYENEWGGDIDRVFAAVAH